MMKKLIVLLAVMLIASSAYAGTNDNWLIQFRAGTTAGASALQNTGFGTQPGALDGEDPSDVPAQAASTTAAWVTAWDLGPGVSNNGWAFDYRAPIEAGQMKIWNLKLMAGSGYTQSTIQLRLWNPASADVNGSIPIKLVVVSDPSGQFGAGTVLVE